MPQRPISRAQAALLVAGVALLLDPSRLSANEGAADPGVFETGPYAFSDELGGFHILSARGSGTHDDPIVIRQELDSSSPVTLVIRAIGPIEPFSAASGVANGILYMRTEVVNNSGQAWSEFEFELQEQLRPAEHLRRRPVVRPAPLRERQHPLRQLCRIRPRLRAL